MELVAGTIGSILSGAGKEVLVEVVRLIHKQELNGCRGNWKEFLNSYDRKFGDSLCDPSKGLEKTAQEPDNSSHGKGAGTQEIRIEQGKQNSSREGAEISHGKTAREETEKAAQGTGINTQQRGRKQPRKTAQEETEETQRRGKCKDSTPLNELTRRIPFHINELTLVQAFMS
ncbi:Small RNA degrading nuclease 3 [Dendrobium catenatum]|uniref:Small RNA degrading nuclease 3 n=1 Tax=Dendrobium catenatum TaxID=906689 RepID=A0A2I0W1I8_9ASPA|nr:Small RNA degrading nuclease 3 [Dendrobium catenatum]